ncbi:MAG: hypothetical protein KA319_03750 [Ferruginibacter sp.]|nr:hypothetical protein [Ferruginibacter sp.]
MKNEITCKRLVCSILLLCTIILWSCEKDSNNATPNPTPANGSFTWTVNGGTTVITADSAFYRAAFKTIFAYKKISGVMQLQYEINLTGGTAATYPVGASNAITYTANLPYFVATAGNVIITANTGTKVTGSFQGTGTLTSGTSSVSGTFTDIPVQ